MVEGYNVYSYRFTLHEKETPRHVIYMPTIHAAVYRKSTTAVYYVKGAPAPRCAWLMHTRVFCFRSNMYRGLLRGQGGEDHGIFFSNEWGRGLLDQSASFVFIFPGRERYCYCGATWGGGRGGTIIQQ